MTTVKQYQATASGRDIYHDAPLTNIAIQAFSVAEGYIAQNLFPVVPVEHQSDRYYVIDRDSWILLANTYRAPKTRPLRIEWKVSSDSYFADNYAVAAENALEDLANADAAIRLRENSTRLVSDALLRDLENRVARLVTSGSNVGSYVSLTTKWSDFVNSDPISDVSTAHVFIRQRTGLKANTLVLDHDTYVTVRRHPIVLDLFKYTAGGLATDEQLKLAFGVDNLLVGVAIKNVAPEGTTASIVNIWGNNALLAYVQPGVSLQTMTFGLAFRWTPEGIQAPMQVRRYEDPDPGKKVEVIEVGYYQDEKIVAKDLAYLIANTL